MASIQVAYYYTPLSYFINRDYIRINFSFFSSGTWVITMPLLIEAKYTISHYSKSRKKKMTRLVIVESPTKARTINGFLPAGYRVEASMGHVRDLPSSAGEVPPDLKKEEWARMGVNIEHDFEPLYVIPDDKKKIVSDLRKLAGEADELLLATDEDREGESIGWHLAELLQPECPVRRMVFHEITGDAIRESLASPRTIDMNLVRAQEARRILDRLVGYTVSPLLWKKIAPRLSAGRVQSVAVRLLVDRERKRRAFHPALYRSVKALLNKRPDCPENRFEAQLHSLGGKPLARGRDFDETTGQLPPGKDLLLLDREEADSLVEKLRAGVWRVTEIQEKEATRHPFPPFTTATLQMEANRKLGMGAAQTMRFAQKLYENGYITYMRTDSVHLSDEAIFAARNRIKTLYGEDFLNPAPRRFRTSDKGAQEAHEAIRPAGKEMRTVESLPLSGLERALYDLIWKRTIATQMKPARLRFQTATIAVDNAVFRASGRIVDFPGFFKAYIHGRDDSEDSTANQTAALPALAVDEEVDCRDLQCRNQETKPPPRYTEATLIKVLKDEGIGRPSTYASIITTIVKRGYVFKQRKELVPTFTAFAVNRLMEEHFQDLVDINFTADMEEHLDNIARGDKGWLEYLRHFYLGEQGLRNRVTAREADVDPRSLFALRLDSPPVEVRVGRFGPFLSWEKDGEQVRTGIQADIPPADLSAETVRRLMKQKDEGPQKLGADPETGLAVYLKLGPFGPYIQRGENGTGEEKPKRIKLPDDIPVEEVSLETALKIIQLPRVLGEHPETGKAVKAGLGRFGPYLVHDGKFTTLKKPHNILEVTLDQAVEILATAPEPRGRGGRVGRKPLRDLGGHPGDGKPVRIMTGRYGPYVNHGRLNASLGKDTDLESFSMEDAVELLEKKAQKKKAKSARKKGKRRENLLNPMDRGRRCATKRHYLLLPLPGNGDVSGGAEVGPGDSFYRPEGCRTAENAHFVETISVVVGRDGDIPPASEIETAHAPVRLETGWKPEDRGYPGTPQPVIPRDREITIGPEINAAHPSQRPEADLAPEDSDPRGPVAGIILRYGIVSRGAEVEP